MSRIYQFFSPKLKMSGDKYYEA